MRSPVTTVTRSLNCSRPIKELLKLHFPHQNIIDVLKKLDILQLSTTLKQYSIFKKIKVHKKGTQQVSAKNSV